MAFLLRFATKSNGSCYAGLSALAGGAILYDQQRLTRCDAANRGAVDAEAGKLAEVSIKTQLTKLPPPLAPKAGMQPDATGDYFGMFLKRQLWQPKLEYPLWDNNWDGREPESTGDKELDRQRQHVIRRNGVTRHIILVRHGQYDESHKDDDKRILTPLGREQADLTGERLAKIIQGAEGKFGPCSISVLAVSGMARAKETADIIAKHLPNVRRADPDSNLNEGRPCHYVPGTKANDKVVKVTDEGHERIEKAFREYFYRDESCHQNDEVNHDITNNNGNDDEPAAEVPKDKHEFVVVVCHANVIRYFLMRALQLPPEAWLRYCPFNCSLTYVTIRPTGTVSCRMFGDAGHIPYGKSTFSQHEGYNW